MPSVCPDNLPKSANLGLDEASTRSHPRDCRGRPDNGDAMYKSLIETDSIATLIVAFAVVLVVVGATARTVRWLAVDKPKRS